MKQRELFFMLSAIILLSCQKGNTTATEYTISRGELLDKIKGGWAGQVIGCTYGGPTEFVWNGTMIGEEVPIPWNDTRMLWYYENSPGLYDDVYMDLLDAPDSLHAKHFANAGGILGTMIGYDKIPAYWKQGLDKVEHLNFAHTDMSLNKVYEPPTDSRIRRLELSWNYDLKEGENSVTLKAKTIPNGYRVEAHDVIVYTWNRPDKVVYY